MVQQSPKTHFLVVAFPGQGLINPALQFAKQLVSAGARVTFVTCLSAHRRMAKDSGSYPEGLSLVPFSDGYDDGWDSVSDIPLYISECKRRGIEALEGLVEKFATEGQSISCIIYTLLLPWVFDVVSKFQLPSALLSVQAAMVLDAHYYYYSGYRDQILDNIDDPEYGVQLPGLPLLKGKDLPSFFHPSNYSPWITLYEQQFETMSKQTSSFRILVNSFDELEPESLKAVEKLKLIAIGPLIPSAFLNGNPSDKSFGGDMFKKSEDYIEWLDSKEKSSVIYVSFGSITILSNKQMEPLARALVDSQRPFLWVVRTKENGSNEQNKDEEKYREILNEDHKGMIVSWCSQVEVLAHESIGCFVTHCGWNSTLETLAMGVPVVAFPQWTDQWTNAKLIEMWKMGVRVKPNEERIVESDEIVRCLGEVMEREELRENAKKWRDLAREAVKEGGSSQRNLRKFVEEIKAIKA